MLRIMTIRESFFTISRAKALTLNICMVVSVLAAFVTVFLSQLVGLYLDSLLAVVADTLMRISGFFNFIDIFGVAALLYILTTFRHELRQRHIWFHIPCLVVMICDILPLIINMIPFDYGDSSMTICSQYTLYDILTTIVNVTGIIAATILSLGLIIKGRGWLRAYGWVYLTCVILSNACAPLTLKLLGDMEPDMTFCYVLCSFNLLMVIVPTIFLRLTLKF